MKIPGLTIGFFLLLLFTSGSLLAQVRDDSTSVLKEITISGYRKESVSVSSVPIQLIHTDSANRFPAFHLTDLLAREPGISQLTTGAAISKPVIRGLYGNRILVLLNGLRFDNQQWQEEHGLGLMVSGIDKIELIRGPFSVLYGTEAMGGIIHIRDYGQPQEGKLQLQYSLKLNGNTRGTAFNLQLSKQGKKYWINNSIGVEENADYTDGKGNRVLNSRWEGYAYKLAMGKTEKNHESTYRLSLSFNRFGFIMGDLLSSLVNDNRYSLSFDVNPYHSLVIGDINTEHIWKLNKSKLTLNAGMRYNKRMENEGGSSISLNMNLTTAQAIARLERPLNSKNKLIVGSLFNADYNLNQGARKLVPDAWMQEFNVSGFIETDAGRKLILENGISVGQKFISTQYTSGVHNIVKEIQPFTKFSPYYNVFSGATYIPRKHYFLKANISTGVRVGNLAELSSCGLHEGTFIFEIGNPNLKNEQVFAANLYAGKQGKLLSFSISPFYNYFLNYIYLAPTNEKWFGFPTSRYMQQDVKQYGTEAKITLSTRSGFEATLMGQAMESITLSGEHTPYIPATKISPELLYMHSLQKKHYIEMYLRADNYRAQNRTAANEISTPEYTLLNAGLRYKYASQNWGLFEFVLNGTNLTNEYYYDHLSRLKNYGIMNMGRMISFQLISKPSYKTL